MSMPAFIRWFFKYQEICTMIELHSAADLWQERNPDASDLIEQKDWVLLKIYSEGVRVFAKVSKMLAGVNYPAACSVIPMLDEVRFYLLEALQVIDGVYINKSFIYIFYY